MPTPCEKGNPANGACFTAASAAFIAQSATNGTGGVPTDEVRWGKRLLADRVAELVIVDGIAPETVRQTLKKTTSSLG